MVHAVHARNASVNNSPAQKLRQILEAFHSQKKQAGVWQHFNMVT
jgi:hypothetical protein